MNAQLPAYRYRVDAGDRLVWVDDWWRAFARENGAAELAAEATLGRPLSDFISGEATREIYRRVHARVREDGRTLVLPFRCDSPTLQRHMQMIVSLEHEDQLLYQCVLQRVETQPVLPVLDAERRRSAAFLTLCSCCKRGLIETAGWLDLEEIAVRLRILERPESPQLRYSVCPDCARLAEPPDDGDVARPDWAFS